MRLRGVTLIELVTALAVLGMLAALAVPAFTTLLLDSRRTASVNALVGAVQLARSEAVKRSYPVTVCKTTDGATCAGPAADWSGGWLVFVPAQATRPTRFDASAEVLRADRPPYRGTISANREAFVFRPAPQRSTNGTIMFCDQRGGAAARAVIVSHTGRPRSSAYSPDGRPLAC
ncbi:MAG: GspH/FimT family pseudopilin [Gammaproteobacteria bacterium]|nr:GspH/FimT family pseudopilin [Gammaproteobacteria bacterium]